MKLKKLLALVLCLMLAGSLLASATAEDYAYTEPTNVYDEIHIGIGGDPAKLSPFAANQFGRQIDILLYENLFYMIGENGNLSLIPCIGKSYEMTDDLTCVVEIFDYVKDSEGNAITAEDVAYCCNLAAELKENNCTILQEATALDDYTIQFTFTRELALGELPNFLRYVPIFDKDAYEASGDSFATAAVTTGPYKCTSFESGYSVTLEINENYWQTDPQYRTKYDEQNVKKIIYYAIPESATMATALKGGDIDFSITVSSADVDYFNTTEGYTVDYVLDNLFYHIQPNCDPTNVMSDVRLRQAVFYAINNEAIAAAVSGGNAEVLHTMGNTKACDYNYDWDTQTGTIYDYNPELAAQLLQEAGYGDGLTLRLLCRSDETAQNIAVMIQAFLAQIGINVEISALEQSSVDTLKTDPANWDIYMTTYTNNDYMAKGWNFVFNPERYSWGKSENFIDDPHLQELLTAARSTTEHSAETVNAMNDYVNENAYGYGLISEKNAEVYSSKIVEAVWDPVGQFLLPNACVYAE